MDRIAKGDLVMIVKPAFCCGGKKSLGIVFRVGKIERTSTICHSCKRQSSVRMLAYSKQHNKWAELGRLKRIPPDILADETHEERRVGV